MRRTALLVLVLAAGVGAACKLAGEQETAPPSSPQSRAEQGQEWFFAYCASCHGPSAHGNGPVAASLRTPPADLTRIAARNGGVFDAAQVASFIDGRNRVGAHGPSDMPVWGRRFDDRSENALEEETRLAPGTIYLVVEYLRSIQSLP